MASSPPNGFKHNIYISEHSLPMTPSGAEDGSLHLPDKSYSLAFKHGNGGTNTSMAKQFKKPMSKYERQQYLLQSTIPPTMLSCSS